MVASAPRSPTLASMRSFRPTPTTRAAPSSFATCTASCPVTPVAPRTNTVSPRASFARCVSDTQAETPGFGNAAAVSSSIPAGKGKQYAFGATVSSAIAPKGFRQPPKNTRVPSSSSPTPSVPQINGKSASRGLAKCVPAAHCLSTGFSEAANTRTSASPSPASGSSNSSHFGALPISSSTAAFTLLAPALANLDSAVGGGHAQIASAPADRARKVLRTETTHYGDRKIRVDAAIRCGRTHLKFGGRRQRSVDAAVGGHEFNFTAPFGASHGDRDSAIRRAPGNPFAGGYIHIAVGGCRFDDAVQVAAANPAVSGHRLQNHAARHFY